MLTKEELFKQAEARGLPATRARSIVREYVHYLILHSINTHTDKLIFTGGTALRLIHNYGRLSFDLDFDAGDLTKDEFAEIIERITDDLSKLGFAVERGRLKQKHNILVVEIKVLNVFEFYGISSAEHLMVKIEVLNLPKSRLKSETKLVRNFDGQTILISAQDLGYMAAEKIAAFFERARERDYYDVLFLALNKAPVDLNLLNRLMVKSKFTGHSDLWARVKSKFEQTDMDWISRKLEPFLIIPEHRKVLRDGVRHLAELL